MIQYVGFSFSFRHLLHSSLPEREILRRRLARLFNKAVKHYQKSPGENIESAVQSVGSAACSELPTDHPSDFVPEAFRWASRIAPASSPDRLRDGLPCRGCAAIRGQVRHPQLSGKSEQAS